jgi:hypothetical protein
VTVYQQIAEPEIARKVQARYSATINGLKQQGFDELCICGETMFPLSVIVLLPLALMMLGRREIVRIHRPLRITLCYQLLVSRQWATYALVFGFGVKFYTNFTDGTGLVSANFVAPLMPQTVADEKGKFYRYAAARPLQSAWEFHQSLISNFTRAGKTPRDELSFENYVGLSRREAERILQQSGPVQFPVRGKGAGWFVLGGGLILLLLALLKPAHPNVWLAPSLMVGGVNGFVMGTYFLVRLRRPQLARLLLYLTCPLFVVWVYTLVRTLIQ